MCEISYCGVAVGSYARKIVKRFIEADDFWTNPNRLNRALDMAKPLVDSFIL